MTRKNLSSAIYALFVMLFFLQSCGEQVHEEGSGNITSETRNIGAFFKLDIEGAYEIVLQEGTNPLIAVETDDNLHQYIETAIDGKTLRIRDVEKVKPSEHTRLIITYQNLDELRLGGAAKVSNQGMLKTEELKIKIDGAGLLDLSLNVEELDLQLDGAGAVNLDGKANKQRLSLSGAGNVSAFELESKDCEINLSGFGSAQVFVTENLNAEVSGVGGIRFKGDPRNIQREVTGLGNIDRAKAE